MRYLRILVIGILLIVPGTVFTVDLTIRGGAGNMAFDPEETASLGGRGEGFSPRPYPIALVQAAGEYSSLISYSMAIERDPILRNRLTTNFGFTLGFIRLDVGPFMGFFNSWERIITPGISAGVTLEWPGILFGALGAGSTIGSGIRSYGDYTQETGSAVLGFWVPHVVNTLGVNLKRFTKQVDDTLITEDEWLRYHLRAEVFTKNVPYTVLVDMGYQTLKRSYFTPLQTETDTLKSVFLGFETTFRINSIVKIILGAEMPVYSWGEASLKNPRDVVLYQAHTGIVLTFAGKSEI
jgi:hypothetical protein